MVLIWFMGCVAESTNDFGMLPQNNGSTALSEQGGELNMDAIPAITS